MRVGVVTSQVPFVRGGAEMHAEALLRQLALAGHQAELIGVPFKGYPARRIPEQMLACRLLDVEESAGVPIDRVIALKFPAYLVPHPQKVIWLLHQHRAAYDLWDGPLSDLRDSPDGAHVRQAIMAADRALIPEARACYSNSRNVSDRLMRHCGLASTPLYHPPPGAEAFARIEPAWGDFLLMPSRLNVTKRQDLVLDALRLTRQPVRVVFMGTADDPAYGERMRLRAAAAGLDGRVTWTGWVGDAEKLRLHAECLAVVFPPVDEDYGYVTLEAMLASKAVLTCTDSGGPLEFVADGGTGLVCEPHPEGLAEAMDLVWRDRARTREMGRAGRARYEGLGVSWDTVLSCLLA